MKIHITKKLTVVLSILLVLVISIGVYFHVFKEDVIPVQVSRSYAVAYDSIQDLVDDSDVIALVKVKKVVKQWQLDNLYPKVDTALEVLKPVYNVKKDQQIIVTQSGGYIKRDGKTYLHVCNDDPLFERGEEYLLFLRENSAGTYTVLGGPQGRFKMIKGKIYPMQDIIHEPGTSRIDINSENLDGLYEQINNSLEKKGIGPRKRILNK